MEINKLKDLNDKKRLKLIDYTKTPAKSWKKKLKRYELNVLDLKIKIEMLKQQFE
jgi:hypothetical protein